MLKILEETLNSIASPEMIALIEYTHEIFNQFELPDYNLEFEELLSTRDNGDPSTIASDIYELTKTLQIQILNKHLIYPTEECTIDGNNVLLNCILQLDKTEYVKEVESICEYELDPTDAFVEIVAIVVGAESVEVATYVDRVEISLIKKIKDLMIRRDSVENIEDNEHVSVQKKVERYKNFADLQNKEKPIIHKLIEQGLPASIEFSSYIEQIRPLITSEDPVIIAREYICAAMLSIDVSPNPRDRLKNELNRIYVDIDKITPIFLEIEKQLLDYDIRMTSGVKVK